MRQIIIKLNLFLNFLTTTIDSRFYKFFCATFLFFKNRLSVGSGSTKRVSRLYIVLNNDLYFVTLRTYKIFYPSNKLLNIYWIFFLYLTNLYFFKTFLKQKKSVYKFWNFLFYLTISGKIIFGAKSVKFVSLFWPKYISTPMNLFNIMQVNLSELKHKKYVFKPTNKPILKKKYNINFFFLKKNKKTKFFFFFKKSVKNFIFYSITNSVKFFTNFYKKYYLIFFLRKQKFFNKGRYSRNRQIYRTGVYWCIYINIIAVLGLNFLFYKFTINFSQYWWFLYFIFICFFFPYFYKNSFNTHFKNIYFFIQYLPKFDFNFNHIENLLDFLDYNYLYVFFYKALLTFFE